MRIRVLIIIALALAVAVPSAALNKPSRPFTGSGIAMIRPFPVKSDQSDRPLSFYREPGVERVAEISSSELPSLAPVLQGPTDEVPVAVTVKKGTWLRIPFDEAGREGWLEMSRHWEYSPWSSFLKGRAIKLLPGLKKDFYVLRREPSVTAPQLDTLSRQRNLRVLEIKEDWALVLVDLSAYGWLRWRDNDGRFAISIDDRFTPQKH